MKNIKIIVGLFLIFALPISSFAVPPSRGHGSTPPRSASHSSYHGHGRPSHHGHHGHHSYHGYYYGSDYYTRDAFWTFLGFSALIWST